MQIESLEIIDHIRGLLDQVVGIEGAAVDAGKPEAPAKTEAVNDDPEPPRENDQQWVDWKIRQDKKK